MNTENSPKPVIPVRCSALLDGRIFTPDCQCSVVGLFVDSISPTDTKLLDLAGSYLPERQPCWRVLGILIRAWRYARRKFGALFLKASQTEHLAHLPSLASQRYWQQRKSSTPVSPPHHSGVSFLTDTPTAIAGACVNLCLPQLLAMLENPEVSSDWLPELAQNNQHRDQLKAVGDLWRSFGRPASGWWRHTYVFCNGILDDSYIREYSMMPNDSSSATGSSSAADRKAHDAK